MTSLRANSIRTRSSPYFITDYSNNVSNYNAYSLSDIATAEKSMDKKDVQHLNDFRNTIGSAISRNLQNTHLDETNQVENAYTQRPYFNKTMGKRYVVGKPEIHTDVFDGNLDVVAAQNVSGMYHPNPTAMHQMFTRANKDSLQLGQMRMLRQFDLPKTKSNTAKPTSMPTSTTSTADSNESENQGRTLSSYLPSSKSLFGRFL